MASEDKQKLRIAIIQRVLASYRRPFFEKLIKIYSADIDIYSGEPMPDETLKTADSVTGARLFIGKNYYTQSPLPLIFWQSGILTWLRQTDPDILVIDINPRILSSWIAIAWMRRKKRPVLGWGLGEQARSGPVLQKWIRRRIAKFVISATNGIIAYSSKAKKDYIAAGMEPENVFVAYNSIDDSESSQYMQQFSQNTQWINSWRKERGFEPNLPIILFVGRLIASKRIDLIIEACAPLFNRCQLLIVGDGPYQSELKSMAAPYGKCIHFAGHQTGLPLAKCFMGSDIFALPGAGGLAIHQAMTYGKPVIVSFGDGTEADLVRENINGLFFKVGDVNSLRSAIIKMLDHPKKIQEMGANSLEIICTQINLPNMAASFMNAVQTTSNRFISTMTPI
ncbi:MAG: glycosyltransferase family 4 protein [Thermodesulfobacteriota bacterium]